MLLIETVTDMTTNPLFYGSIPNWLTQHEQLQQFDISNNLFLVNLERLLVEGKSFVGVISEANFAKLSKLEILHLSSGFEFNVGPHWVPPFQLDTINLSNTKLGPYFPAWLYTQRLLSWLDISSLGISSINEGKFWIFVLRIDFHFV